MFIAVHADTGNLVDIDEAIWASKQKYKCPCCDGELIIKNGRHVVPHFAHKSLKDCENWTSDMSEWHYNWQSFFPIENREVVLTLETTDIEYKIAKNHYNFETSKDRESGIYNDTADLYNNNSKKIVLKHRADVLIHGYVIEFQHSPISSREFNERNWFYEACGYKVIWIFDFIEEYAIKKIYCYKEWYRYGKNGGCFQWEYPKKIFSDFEPQKNKNVSLFFQLAEIGPDYEYLEKVSWAIYDEDACCTNFKRFFTDYSPGVPTNKEELINWISKKYKKY